MPTLTMAELWALADAYFAEGSAAVERATVQWQRARDPEVPEDFRRVALGRYRVIAAYARTRFRRHDMLLDRIAARELAAEQPELVQP